MKALLIYPEFAAFSFWNYKEVCELTGAKYPAAPLGLITVAALFPKDWEVKLVDMNTEELDESLIDWADLVFVGGMLPQQLPIMKLIDLVHSKNKKIVVGGPDPTSQPHLYPKADYLVLGEAEATFQPFLKDLENGVEKGVYKSNEKPDMCISPIPRYDLLNFENYIMVGVQFCRGCPFNCEFCDIIELYGRKVRAKSPEQIIAELETLYELGYRGHIDFVDDNFIGNKKHSMAVLEKLKEWTIEKKYPFYYSTEASVNLADNDEMLQMMKECDFRFVFFGIETSDPEILKATNKKQNVNRSLFDDLDKIMSYGITVNAGFILGFDNETHRGAELMVKTIDEGKICMSMLGLLYALPNTQLTKRLEKEGRLFHDKGELDETNINVDQASSGINFKTTRPVTEIFEDFIFVINSVYDKKSYFNRALRYAMTLQPKYKHKPNFKKVLGFAKAFFKVSLRLKRHWVYWRNILVLLFRHPASLEPCVNVMAMWIHFRKQTDFITKVMNQRIKEVNEIGEENYYKDKIPNYSSRITEPTMA